MSAACGLGGASVWAGGGARSGRTRVRKGDQLWGGEWKARVERTANMDFMLVTLEVFQPDMSALNFDWYAKSSDMSVMPETSQSAMGPYCAIAEPVLRLNSLTAACRAVLAAKVVGGGSGGGSGGKGGGEGARPGG